MGCGGYSGWVSKEPSEKLYIHYFVAQASGLPGIMQAGGLHHEVWVEPPLTALHGKGTFLRLEIKKTATVRTGTGCLVLFALPFAAVGVFMAVLIGRTCWTAHSMALWWEVPAIITKVESKGSGEDSRKTVATYRYEVAGRSYTGDRVSMHSGGDNIGSFQPRVYAELKRHQESGEPFRCYVNPQDPADAILYRQVRWEMLGFFSLFMLIFGGVGFGILFGSRVAQRRAKLTAAAQAERPQEPWLWNPAWAGGVIRDNNRAAMWFALFFMTIWNAISMPAGFLVMRRYNVEHHAVILLVMIFPVMGAGLLISAARLVWRQIKYGTALLRMSRMPGVIGGALQGLVEIPAHIQPADGFRISLRCVNRTTTDTGKERSTHEAVLWEDVRVQAQELQDGNPAHALLPVSFLVPRHCRPTDMQTSDNQIIWRLDVEAAGRGTRYASRFEVPMFVTADSVADVRPEGVAAGRCGRRLRPEETLRETGAAVEALPGGGVRYTFPAGRNKSSALFITAFFAIWTGAIYLMLRVHAPLVMPILFGLSDIFVGWGVLSAWFDWRSIEIASNEVAVAGGIFGLAGVRRFALSAIVAVEANASSSQGDKQFFALKLRTQAGGKHTIAKGILGRAVAEALAADLRRQLQLREEAV